MARDALTDAPVPPGENSPPLLELVGVSAAPPGSRAPVLTGVDLRLTAGTCGVLLGGNGAGKSTLLRTAAGLWPPRAGTVRSPWGTVCSPGSMMGPHAGTVRSPSETAFDPRRVALVLEDPAAQFLAATVAEELEFALENQGFCREEILSRRDATLAAFALEPLRHRDPATLSPGEQSRCLIAAALVLEPRVLLLDDTFLYLGPGEGGALWKALCREVRRDQWRTVLLATHDGDLAAEADYAGILAEGRLRAWGPPAVVLRQELPASVEPPLDLWMEDALRRQGIALPAGDLGVEGLAGRLASGGGP